MIRRETGRPFLSAVFVDYDNIYLSLKRKNDEAAKRFARDAAVWTKAIESGALITSTNGPSGPVGSEQRRIVMNRCYGNPVPRRNQSDNSTDMNSFPFVRHHFLRAGFEIIDCPPLTAQLKNSSDIRMVMDVVDHLAHGTHFDEFVILSGDADFTPVLHRLRAHARRTVIFANDYTAAPYTAISDGEVREADLINLLLEYHGEIGNSAPAAIAPPSKPAMMTEADREALRREIISDVAEAVRAAPQPVPLEVLADRAVRTIGHDRTVATSWAGAGGFRELLTQTLPDDLRLSEQPPYMVIDTRRHLQQPPRSAPLPELPDFGAMAARVPAAHPAQSPRGTGMGQAVNQGFGQGFGQGLGAGNTPQSDHYDDDFRPERALPPPAAAQNAQGLGAQGFGAMPSFGASPAERAPYREPMQREPLQREPLQREPMQREPAPRSASLRGPATPAPTLGVPQRSQSAAPAPKPAAPAPMMPVEPPAAAAARPKEPSSTIQQSIARIHEACQAPPLAPPEYRTLFEVMALEINENNLLGAQTIQNVLRRAEDHGLKLRRDDVRFVMDVVSEADPWFEQGASANLFAGRFRNFVVARCRGQGLKLSADELDLIEAWFVGNVAPTAAAARPQAQLAGPSYASPNTGMPSANAGAPRTADEFASDEFPRIVRTRLRG